jgi:arsenite methyltransferase
MTSTTDDLRDEVRSRYAAAARTVAAGGMGCCGSEPSCCGSDDTCTDDRFGPALYALDERAAAPDRAFLASLGCGNPTAVAELREGETVLDLGSGGGLDVILSARRVGETGVAYGVDMTGEMLDLARAHAAEARVANVEFLKGEIEAVPLPDASVDVVISNCVINLSTDKPAVLREMARVLRPGGRIGVSDVVADDNLTQADRERRGSFVGCIAGALSFAEYDELLRGAGFEQISVDPTHQVADGMHSAIVRAVLPTTTTAKEV